MIVTISLRAEADIVDLAAYVARDSPQAGERLANALYDACLNLSPFPASFMVVEELQRPGVRRRPVGDYLVFYVIRPDDVFILRVLHGARDYVRLLNEA